MLQTTVFHVDARDVGALHVPN